MQTPPNIDNMIGAERPSGAPPAAAVPAAQASDLGEEDAALLVGGKRPPDVKPPTEEVVVVEEEPGNGMPWGWLGLGALALVFFWGRGKDG